MLPIKQRLMLVNIEHIIMKEKKTGKELPKIKYTFKAPTGDILERYLDDEGIENGKEPFREMLVELNEKLEYEESKSNVFTFNMKTYTDESGKTTTRYLMQK